MRRFTLTLLSVISVQLLLFAQTRQLTGTVQDATGAGIISATVSARSGNFITATNTEGKFSLNLPAGTTLIEVSSVGYVTQTISVNSSTNDITVTLQLADGNLSEVVVTALGIVKEAKKVGYAVTTVQGDALTKARETNVANSLSGRVAGLKVSGTSSGPGGTAKVLLRGMPSMNSGGSPLYVINGIPIDNTQKGGAGEWGGSDNGDGIGNLNPDDIESMTVLKGQSASALYGARATNGVIIITTKTGKRNSFAAEYNMNYMVEQPIDFTDFQYVYGQGEGGAKPTTALAARNSNRMSWGAKLDGSQVIQFDGNSYPYSAVKDNISFYRTAPAFTNTFSVAAGSNTGFFRLSASTLDGKSIVRNKGLKRQTINFNGEQKIADKLTANVLVNYINQVVDAVNLSDGPMNPNNFTFLATNVSHNIFNPGYDPTTGFETQFSDDEYVTNPWFVVNKGVNNLGRKRWITNTSLKYDFTNWLYAQARLGYDVSNDRLLKAEPWGTAYTADKRGNLQDLATSERYELNIDGLVGATHQITENLNLDAVIGANLRKNQYEKVAVGGGYFLIPNQYTLGNVKNPRTDPGSNYDFWKTEVHSAYYSLDFSYKNFLNLSTTGRYDAYSTLPTHSNTIFTPSVSLGLVFTDIADINSLNFGKLRMSYAQTSGDPKDAYVTALYYSLGSPLGGIPMGSFSSGMPNLFLKPFVVSEFEIGTELKFFNNRLGLDLAWYNKKTKNEIMPATYSPATGATSGVVGTGATLNTGVELQLTGTPVKTGDFSWVSTFNLTSVKNKIVETDAKGKNQNLGSNRGTLGNAITAFVKGYAGPQILAYDYKRHSNGQIIVDAAGLPQRGDLIKMGSVLPTLFGGWNNELNYKSLNFSFLIDYNFGNKILSATKYYALRRGLDQATLEGREGGIKTGVYENGTPNTVAAPAQAYYTALANNVTSVTVLDGDFIKLRQMTLGYTLGQKIVAPLRIFSGIQVSLVARNLAVLMKKSDNVDPEASFGSNIRYAGIEGTSLPSTRSYGINVNFKFKK